MAGGKRILVVGGTSPFGRAVVEARTAGGDAVVFNGRDGDRGTALTDMTGAGFLQGDFNPAGEAERIVSMAVEKLGGLDGLVLASGLLHRARISETTDAAWDAVLETNLIAPFRLAKAAMPALAEGGGAIVVLASGTACWTEMELGAYSAAKRAVLWMTKMLAVEGGPRGVSVNAVCPGDTADGMGSVASEPQMRDLGAPSVPPVGRLATPQDIARAVGFFLDGEDAYCTGASLMLDGGLRAALRAGKVHQA